MDNRINAMTSRAAFRVVSLLLAVMMIFTSGSAATALDNPEPLHQLSEQRFTLTPERDVTVTLEGLMPAGGYADAEPADMEGEEILHAYDITIHYPDGAEFEPAEDAPITVSFRSDAIAQAIGDSGTAVEAAHIFDDGTEESIALTSAEDDAAVFEAESFSIYVIKTHDKNNENLNPRRTYHFLSPLFSQTEIDGVTHYQAPAYEFPNKLNEPVTTQTIRSGESLQEIVMPENANSGLFYGWFVVQFTGTTQEVTTEENKVSVTRTNYVYDWGIGTPEHVGFNEPIVFDDTEDSDVYLAPLFGRYRFLTFHQDVEGSANANTIISRKLIALGDDRKCTLKISDVRAPSTNPNRIIFWGWKFTHAAGDTLEGETETIQTVRADDSEIEEYITIEDQNIINGIQPTEENLRNMIYDIWPVFKEARWVEFNVGGNGASYRPAQFIMIDDQTTGFNNVPTRTGYEFLGWYYSMSDGNGGTTEVQVADGKTNILTGVTKELDAGMKIEEGELKLTAEAPIRIVFYAKWKAVAATKYHVTIWKQKATDDKDATDKTYDFAGYEELEGSTAEKAYETAAYTQGGYESMDYEGFHYARHQVTSDDDKNQNPTIGDYVNPDGSTMVNVYYDRNLVTLRFLTDDYAVYSVSSSGTYLYVNNRYYQGYTSKSGSRTYYLSYNNAPYTGTVYSRSGNSWSGYSYTPVDSPRYNTTYYGANNGSAVQLSWVQYTGSFYEKSFSDYAFTTTDLYGKNTAYIFNNAPFSTTYKGYSWSDIIGIEYSEILSSIELMPKQDVTFYGSAGGTAKTIYYYTEVLDGEPYDREYDGRYYTLHKTIAHNYNFITFDEEYHPIEGYERDDSWAVPSFYTSNSVHRADIGDDNVNYLYYHRISSLKLMYNLNYEGRIYQYPESLTYNASLAGYDEAYIPEREHYIFSGWYEDEGCTESFDFDHERMPNANKVVYAKWTPVKYRVMVDPDGGEFLPGEDYATFFNVDWDEEVGEYNYVSRNYIQSTNGNYVYVNFQYDKVCDFPGVKSQPKGLPAQYRKAFYIEKDKINETYYKTFTDTDGEKVYSYADSGMTLEEFKSCIDMNTLYEPVSDEFVIYKLASWHRVRGNSVEQAPFNFKSTLTEPVTIRARWVQVGGYSLTYNPTMASTGITGTIARVNDPLESGRKYADKSPVVILQEPSNLSTTGAGGHGINVTEWLFRGWRVVDGRTREPLEDNVFYDPGDTMILDARLADAQGVIHMEAYYERKASTVRRVDVTSVTLHANSQTASVNAQGLAGDRYESADIPNKQLKLERRNNNFKVELSDYIKNFTNSDGSLLLGWNTTPDEGTYIPEYYADAVIGVNKENLPNNLYAVWEPMIYLTLENTTTQPITFNLKFENYDGTVYQGYANSMNDEVLDRKPFSEESYVTKNSSGNFDVTLPSKASVKLVIPEGVIGANAGAYSITGTYATNNTKNLYVYNSGSERSVSIVKRNSSWYLNGSYTSASPISYETKGSLVSGPQGRLVRFVEENTRTKLNLQARYYDLNEEKWVAENPLTGKKEDAHFVLTNSSDTEKTTTDGYTTSVNLINNNLTNTFGLKVNSYDSDNYKFIGWYYTPEAAPNTYSVDRHANDFGLAEVGGLAVPSSETNYYALFVPYIKGKLTIVHDERADSAGNCDSDKGLGLKLEYYTKSDKSDLKTIGSDFGNDQDPAAYTLDETYINEKSVTGNLVVTVSAKPDTGSTYKATYRNGLLVPSTDLGHDANGYTYAVFDTPLADQFVYSDTVKGLMELRTVSYSTVFSRGYTISYEYTARDGSTQKYVKQGATDTYDDFDIFVIEQTPYERSLAGNTVWDIENISRITNENGMNATLKEIESFREKCTVTIVKAGGYTPTERVEYGNTFSEEQAARHLAPSTNADGQQFDYWEIVNTKTGEHIANCYSEKFTFAVWNDYTITPHYSDTPATLADENRHITVDYIETSRNQWGTEIENDDSDLPDRSGVTDKLVADIDISFIDGDRKILDAVDANGNYLYQLGMMFEVVGTTEDGSFDAANYSDGEAGMKQRVQTLINANTKASGSARISGVNCYYSKIGINENTVSGFNRSQFARSFNTAAVGDKVLRMYAYMQTPDGEIVISAPKYITMYDYAKSNLAIEMA